MNVLGRITVLPDLPERLERLHELARNLYWSWSPEARALFRAIDPDAWERAGHEPVSLLRNVSAARLRACADDEGFLQHFDRVLAAFDAYLAQPGWFGEAFGQDDDELYAYFCAEYGWHEALPLYSGGLGILAGDHTKAASDLGVPLVAVGLWYPEGYFHQRIDAEGTQEAVYLPSRPFDLPFERVVDEHGAPVSVRVQPFGRDVEVRALQTYVGRVRVLLLDVDHDGNEPEDRAWTRRLYGGGDRIRIAQEIILGVGGVRMLRALALAPSAWHMNEGHSAFLALERCREHVAEGMDFAAARELVRASTCFTVHTPVAAGNDAFPFELVSEAFGTFWRELDLRQGGFHALGSADHGWGPVFSMPALALRFATSRNGVSELHGRTSRRIWTDLWPGVPPADLPIGHVTNGVHTATWLAPETHELLDAALPSDWERNLDDAEPWAAVRDLDPARVWRARRNVKAKAVRVLRRRVLAQLRRQEASPTAKQASTELLDPDALTIGFARRFATYKRATLVFRDEERLARLLTDPERPVQLVFAGKAHPADEAGQELIRRIHELAADPRMQGRILFVEDYDMEVGRALTRGVDVWLNTPRRPLEASGTSGQKAAMNGVLNLSVLDGWWPEGYAGDNGWAIGNGNDYGDPERADAADADALYALLEREVVPLYYGRDEAGVPREWITRALAAMASVTPRFNAQRMIKDYVREHYRPAAERGRTMAADGAARARDLAAWRERVEGAWDGLYFEGRPAPDAVLTMGDEVTVEGVLNPGRLDDVALRVEAVYRRDDADDDAPLACVPLEEVERYPDGGRRFRATFRPELTGRLAYGLRTYPHHPDLPHPFDMGFVRWA